MNIAQVAPLYESVPPRLYGGTERVVSFLTEELVAMGHKVTLFASGDSQTDARLISAVPQALRLGERIRDPWAAHTLQLQQVLESAGQFDIIHFHTDHFHFPLSLQSGYCHVTTLHGRLDLGELTPVYKKFRDIPLVSISESQRKPVSFANFIANVYHGIPRDLFSEGPGGDYAVVVGRFSPEKGIDKAIEIAGRAGLKLKIAAKVEQQDAEYFEIVMKPLLQLPHVEYIGEVNESDKQKLLGEAKVFLFPIEWPEPFGIVMIEALACGTPVVAFPNGSVPEIITHEKTGFIVNSTADAVEAVRRIGDLNRSHCRSEFEKRFLSSVMAENYLRVYQHAIRENEQIRLPFPDRKHSDNYLDNMLSA